MGSYRSYRTSTYWHICGGHHRWFFQIVLGLLLFIGWGLSMVQAQHQEPPNVTDPETDQAVAAPTEASLDQNPTSGDINVIDLALTNSVPIATTDLTDTSAANQVLALLAAGTGIALGVGLSRGDSMPTRTEPFTWPPWAHTVAPAWMNLPPTFWQNLLQTEQDWLTAEFRVIREENTIMLQRLDGVRILASHPIATIQPGGIDFHWQTTTDLPQATIPPIPDLSDDITASNTVVPSNTSTAMTEDELAYLLAQTNDPYERFLLIRRHAPERIVTQDTPTDQAGRDVRILTDPAALQVPTDVPIEISIHRGIDEPVVPVFDDAYIPDATDIESFVMIDPFVQERQLTYPSFLFPPPVITHPDGSIHRLTRPRPVLDDPDGTFRWPYPGTHTVVYEVTEPGQLPMYYTLEQEIVDPASLAATYLREESIPMDPELYLLRLHLMRLEMQLIDQIDEDELESIDEAIDNATTMLDGGAEPIQAVLIPDETLQPISLRLFLQETDEGYVIIDLTDPQPDAARTYRGETVEEAWEDFVDNNTLPAGQIAATPPMGTTSTDTRWNTRIDGQSTLQEWSEGLSIASWATFGTGVVLLFVPGGQLAGVIILGTSAGAQFSASAVSLIDRWDHDNLTLNTQTVLEVLDMAGSLAGGGALVRTIRQAPISSSGADRLGIALETVDEATNIASTVIVTYEYYEEIERIQNDSNLSEEEKAIQIRRVLLEASQQYGIIGFRRIASRVISQRINQFRIDTLFEQRGVSPEFVTTFLQHPDVVARQSSDPRIIAQALEHPGFINRALEDTTLIDDFLADGLSVVRVIDAAHAADLNLADSRRLLNDARDFGQGQLDALGNLALEGRLIYLLRTGIDDQTVNILLSDYGQAGVATLADLLQHGMPLERARRTITIAQDLEQLPLVHDLVTSGRFHQIDSLAIRLDAIRTELRIERRERLLQQLAEARQRVQRGHTVALTTAPDRAGRGDVIDLTTEEALQIEVVTGSETSTVANYLQRAAEQFAHEIPPEGFRRVIDLRIDNADNPLVGMDRHILLETLRTNLDQTDLAGVDEIRITTDPTTTHILTPEEFR